MRKNYEKLKNIYKGLERFLPKKYNTEYSNSLCCEIYFLEKLLKKWGYHYPESNIDFKYYLDAAELEYEFFIKNKLSMPRELREYLFKYTYKEEELSKQNIFIITKNIKKAQKSLEMMIYRFLVYEDYDSLFIYNEILGDLYLHIHILSSLYQDKEVLIYSDYIFQAFYSYNLSLKYKKKNEDPEVYREGLIGLSYFDVYSKFFERESPINIHYLEDKIEFLIKYYYNQLSGHLELYQKSDLNKEESSFSLYTPEIIKQELTSLKKEIAEFVKLKQVELENNIYEKCKALVGKIPKYQNRDMIPADFADFLSQFETYDMKNGMFDLLMRVKYITKEDMQNYLLELLEIGVPKMAKNIFLLVFESTFQKSQDAWTYFTKFYTEKKFQVLKSAEDFFEIISNINGNEDYYFIFIDDVIGTGDQFCQIIEDELNDYINRIMQITSSNRRIHFKLISGIGSWESKKVISEKVEFLSESDILFKKNFDVSDKAFNPDKWKNKELLAKTLDFLFQKDPLFYGGYGGCEYLIVLDWNVPDNTIGCLWHNPNGWRPLFKRK